jgi:hypothetical protein
MAAKRGDMQTRNLDPDEDKDDWDWEGNNLALKCPVCSKVFIVSAIIHKGHRECPKCHRSIGRVKGGRKRGGTASIEWEKDE